MQTFSASCLAKDIQSKLLEIWETQNLADLYWNKMKFDKQIAKTQKSAEQAVEALEKLFGKRKTYEEIYRECNGFISFLDISVLEGYSRDEAVDAYFEISSKYQGQ